jgi:hypothetical protein
MKDIDYRRIAQDQGEYDAPTIDEQISKGKVIGKLCFDQNSRFVQAAGDEFVERVAEIISKRYPKASIDCSLIDGENRCSTYVVSSIDKDDVMSIEGGKDISASLSKKGFKDLGSGLFKKGNDLWSLKVDDSGNHNIVRSEVESNFGTELSNQEVIVSKSVKDDMIEVMSRKEVFDKGLVVDEITGKIVNSFKDSVGTLLFIIE